MMESSDGVLHLEADDPRVEPYRNLKERDLAGRGELFILEGENSVHNLVQHGRMPLESVCISEKRVFAFVVKRPGLARSRISGKSSGPTSRDGDGGARVGRERERAMDILGLDLVAR